MDLFFCCGGCCVLPGFISDSGTVTHGLPPWIAYGGVAISVFSVFQTHCLSIPQSLGQASAVLDSHRHWRVAFEPDTPQPPKHKHGINKPIQIQNNLAKSATCAACIDMDRSFLASSTGMLPMGGPTSSAALT